MSKPTIVAGDLTTTGGVLIPSQTTRKVNGKSIILLGDKFFCPTCKAMGSVIEASRIQLCNGTGVAYHGCRVQCSCSGRHMALSTQSTDLTQ